MREISKEEFLHKALELAVQNARDAKKIMKGLLVSGAFDKNVSGLEKLLDSKDVTITVLLGDLAGALSAYLQNTNVYRFMKNTKEEFVYYIDNKGVPYAFPKKQELERKKRSEVGYV